MKEDIRDADRFKIWLYSTIGIIACIVIGISGALTLGIKYKLAETEVVIKTDTLIVNNPDDIYQANYNNTLLYIMWSEGLVIKATKCPANVNTIGFGHTIQEAETFDNFNYRNAYELLECDFDECIEQAESLGFTKCNNEQLAVAHIIYALGNAIYPILEDTTLNILDKYIWYTKDGIQHTSSNLVRNRAFEKELYFSKDIIIINNYF